MARSLYDEAPAFREALDRCLQAAGPELQAKLHTWLVESAPANDEVAQALAETRHAQPALFAMSYGLASWLESLGVRPDAVIGHSIGEYAAACCAGVFSIKDGMSAVIARGQAMFTQPRGAMLAVRLSTQRVAALLPSGVEVAGNNAPALTVVAGGFNDIDAFASALEAQDIGTTKLKVSHAFHSESMQGALPLVNAALHRIQRHAPRLTVYSCVSGSPLQDSDATDPQYWARQVREPVQFSKMVQAELSRGDAVFIEVGPGQALSALVRQHRTPKGEIPRIVSLLGAAQDPGDAAFNALIGLGGLWSAGVNVSWPVAVNKPRVALPTYPFQGQRYWFTHRASSIRPTGNSMPADNFPVSSPPAEVVTAMSRLPTIEIELKRILSDVSGVPSEEIDAESTFVDQGLDSLSLTQATLEFERVFGLKLRFRRLLEDLDTVGKLSRFLDSEMPADKFAPPASPTVIPTAPAAIAPAVTTVTNLASRSTQGTTQPTAVASGIATQSSSVAPDGALHALLAQQMQLMSQQLTLLAGQPSVASVAMPVPAAVKHEPMAAAPSAPQSQPHAADTAQPSIKTLLEKPFGASARITLEVKQEFTPQQREWLDKFVARYVARSGKSKNFSQANRKLMADPRVVTGFNPLWKDLVYPIVADRSKGSRVWDIDGNEYIDLLSCFGANFLGYQPSEVIAAMEDQLHRGLEVGPQPKLRN
jgi:acyl transferase domain-containing protein